MLVFLSYDLYQTTRLFLFYKCQSPRASSSFVGITNTLTFEPGFVSSACFPLQPVICSLYQSQLQDIQGSCTPALLHNRHFHRFPQ